MDFSILGNKINTAVKSIIARFIPPQTNNNGKFLTTNGTNTSWASISAIPTINNTLTSLAIDCSLADVFQININSSQGFSLINATSGKCYEIIVKNTATTDIIVTMPSGQVYDVNSITITAGTARRFYLCLYSNKFYWDYSKGLVNA